MKQHSYVRISDSLHPYSEEYCVCAAGLNKPTGDDFKIVDEIIGYNTLLGLKEVGGEWGWLNGVKRKVYIDALECNDRETLAQLFCNFFQNSCGYGTITPAYNEISKLNLTSQILWDVDAAAEFCSSSVDIEILYSPEYGAPFGLSLDNKVILPDSPRHLYFAQKLTNLGGKILEIGGGYGGLAYFLKRLGFEGVYFNVDLPETLYVAYYYLRKNGFQCKMITGADSVDDLIFDSKTIYFVPHFLFNEIAPYIECDVFFNANSLSEMDIKYVDSYFNLINVMGPGFILHSNSNYLAFPDSERHIEILAKDFPIDSTTYKKIYQCISPFQGASGRYREFLYQKI